MSGVEHILAIAALLLVMLPVTGAGLRDLPKRQSLPVRATRRDEFHALERRRG